MSDSNLGNISLVRKELETSPANGPTLSSYICKSLIGYALNLDPRHLFMFGNGCLQPDLCTDFLLQLLAMRQFP